MKSVIHDPEVIRRMRQTFDLFQAAEELKMQNIRRREPGITKERLRQELNSWRISRPAAELGDAPGRVASDRFPEWQSLSSKKL